MPNQPLPGYQRTTRIKGSVNVPAIQSVTGPMASGPTALGAIGSQMALKASVALAEKQGYEAGQTPHGDIGTPITATDEAFAKAYSAQAESTLGLQAHQLLQENQLQMAQTNKLTPDLIAQYEKSTSEGLQQILEQAPSSVRRDLSNQFSYQMLNSSGQLNLRYIKQQKAQEKDRANLYNRTQNQNIVEYGLSNNLDAAKEGLESLKARANANYESGLFSGTERDTAIHNAQLSYYSGAYSRKLVEARDEKKEPEFLRWLGDPSNKPKDMTFADWQTVGSNVLQYNQKLEQMQSQDKALILSQLDRQLFTTGAIPPAQLEEAKQKLDETTFNKVMTSLAKYNERGNKRNAAVNEATANYGDELRFNQSEPKAKDDAYRNIVQQYLQEHPNVLEWEAKTEAAMSAGGFIPSYTKELNDRLKSLNPQFLTEGGIAYEKLNAQKPQNLGQVDKLAIANYHAFERQVAQGVDPVEAASNAHQIVYAKNQEQREANNEYYKSYSTRNLSSPSARENHALELSGQHTFWTGFNPRIRNMGAFTQRVNAMFKDNFHLLNGDEGAAATMTRQAIERNWAHTKVNGDSEYMFMPPEKALGIDEAAGIPVIHADMVSQLQNQFQVTKDLYDKHNGPYWLETKDATNLAALTQLSEEYQRLGPIGLMKDFAIDKSKPENKRRLKLMNQLDDLYEAKPIKVVQHMRGGTTREFEVVITPSANMVRGQDESGMVVGDYHILMKEGDKNAVPIPGLDGLGMDLIYRPRHKDISDAMEVFAPHAMAARRKAALKAAYAKEKPVETAGLEFLGFPTI